MLGSGEKICNKSGMWEGAEPKCISKFHYVSLDYFANEFKGNQYLNNVVFFCRSQSQHSIWKTCCYVIILEVT
jgi:hypothetical protein